MNLRNRVLWYNFCLYHFENKNFYHKNGYLFKDIKIGVRTFLEENPEGESNEKTNEPRSDLFKKIIKLSSTNENIDFKFKAEIYLTNEEKLTQTLSKKRFMQWRQLCTSSSTLGFRIEAINVIIFVIRTSLTAE